MGRFEFRWKNFHGFEDTGWIEVKPVTILIGANNSGKTSLHAPLLLLKQTDMSEDPYVSLMTKGPLINAGAFRDIVFRHDTSREISLAVRFHYHPPASDDSLEPIGDIPPGVCEFSFGLDEESLEIVLKTYEILDAYGRKVLRRHRSMSGSYSLQWLEKAIGSPSSKSTKDHQAFDSILRKLIRGSVPNNFLFTDQPFRDAALKVERLKKAEMSKFSLLYLRAVEWVKGWIFNLLYDISYIGPLRERPQRLYEVSGEMPANVGTRGEFAPEIIYRLRNTDLLDSINEWLDRFEFASNMKCKSLGEDTFSIMLSRGKTCPPVNFADTGFGMSQVLPLIVQGLYSEGNRELIIAEQPEIHLNPKLQAQLANLFCHIAKLGSDILIETHSEHLILRLRRLVAQGDFPAEDVALYYVEKREGQSFIREVPIKANGHIETEDWPEGFFGESLKDALGLVTAQSRRKKNA